MRFTSWISAEVTPYCSAIFATLSPEWTMWRRMSSVRFVGVVTLAPSEAVADSLALSASFSAFFSLASAFAWPFASPGFISVNATSAPPTTRCISRTMTKARDRRIFGTSVCQSSSQVTRADRRVSVLANILYQGLRRRFLLVLFLLLIILCFLSVWLGKLAHRRTERVSALCVTGEHIERRGAR